MIRGREQLASLAPLTQYLATAYLDYLDSHGVDGTVTSTQRSYIEQARLWWAWITGRSRIPAAPPGESRHEIGLAFDFSTADPRADPATLNAIAQYFWLQGPTPRDPVHHSLDCDALLLARYQPDDCRRLPWLS